MGEIKAILRYPGAKWKKADWIVSHFPAHYHYLEPYCGSAACFFAKKPVPHEILNDINSSIVNLFRVLREQGEALAAQIALSPYAEEDYQRYKDDFLAEDSLEHARRFLVCCWQSHASQVGGGTGWRSGRLTHYYLGRAATWNLLPERLLSALERLKQAEIRHRPALELIGEYNASDCLIYADPPYLLETRAGKLYQHEMVSEEEHSALLDVLEAHRGPVILSGYSHPLYEKRLAHWTTVAEQAQIEKGQFKTEVLWLNQKAAAAQQQHSLFS